MMQTGAEFDVVEVGTMHPSGLISKPSLQAGDVGYIAASIKSIEDTAVGDTITDVNNPTKEPLDGYKKALPMVFSGVFPLDGSKFNDLKEAISKKLPPYMIPAFFVKLVQAVIHASVLRSQHLGFQCIIPTVYPVGHPGSETNCYIQCLRKLRKLIYLH